jgi:hypothetical protein
MLLDFRNHVDGRGHVEAVGDDPQRLVNRREITSLKFDVEHGADDLNDFADRAAVGGHVSIRRRHTVSNSSSTYKGEQNWQV